MLGMKEKANPWPAKLRQLQGDLSNQEMADNLGVSFNTYRSWLYGRRTPSGPAVKLIEVLLQQKKRS